MMDETQRDDPQTKASSSSSSSSSSNGDLSKFASRIDPKNAIIENHRETSPSQKPDIAVDDYYYYKNKKDMIMAQSETNAARVKQQPQQEVSSLSSLSAGSSSTWREKQYQGQQVTSSASNTRKGPDLRTKKQVPSSRSSTGKEKQFQDPHLNHNSQPNLVVSTPVHQTKKQAQRLEMDDSSDEQQVSSSRSSTRKETQHKGPHQNHNSQPNLVVSTSVHQTKKQAQKLDRNDSSEFVTSKTKPDLSKFRIHEGALNSLEKFINEKPDLLSTYKEQEKVLQTEKKLKKPTGGGKERYSQPTSTSLSLGRERTTQPTAATENDPPQSDSVSTLCVEEREFPCSDDDETSLESKSKSKSKTTSRSEFTKGEDSSRKHSKQKKQHKHSTHSAMPSTRRSSEASQSSHSAMPSTRRGSKASLSTHSAMPSTRKGSEASPSTHSEMPSTRRGSKASPKAAGRAATEHKRYDHPTSFRIDMVGNATPSDSSVLSYSLASGRTKYSTVKVVDSVRTHHLDESTRKSTRTRSTHESRNWDEETGNVTNASADPTKVQDGKLDQDVMVICCQRSIKKRKLVICIIIFMLLVLVAIVVPLTIWWLNKPPNDGIERLNSYPDRKVVSAVPFDLCNEGYPGQDTDLSCTVAGSSAKKVGSVCDIVAQAMMKITGGDLAIINSGACKKGILSPQMTVGDIRAALQLKDLVVVETHGQNIITALEDAMEATFGPSEDESAYPHAAGIRFDVKSNLDMGNRVHLVEIDVDHLHIWRPINPRRFYKIVTTSEIAKGGLGYSQFGLVIDKWKFPLPFTSGDALLSYALQNKDNWWEMDTELYSTQSFVSPDVEVVIAKVPETICLEWLPGYGKSYLCPLSTSMRTRGGGVCNLVAWGLLDQNLKADISIFKSSLCGSDIASGNFTEGNAQFLLPGNETLVTVRLTGEDIVTILNRGVDFASAGGKPDVYPYAGALRYTVNITAVFETKVSSVEVMNKLNRWVPLSATDEFTVLTTRDLATGQDRVYEGFSKAAADSFVELDVDVRETFIKYATAWGELNDPSPGKYSTQIYIH